MRPWLSVRAMTLRAKCRTLDWLWKNASNTCFRYSCMMELLIPDEISPISFRSSCLDSFFPARQKVLINHSSNMSGFYTINNNENIYTLCLPPASVCPPPEDMSGGFWGSGFWGWWRRSSQPKYHCTKSWPLEQTSGWDAWSQGSLKRYRKNPSNNSLSVLFINGSVTPHIQSEETSLHIKYKIYAS